MSQTLFSFKTSMYHDYAHEFISSYQSACPVARYTRAVTCCPLHVACRVLPAFYACCMLHMHVFLLHCSVDVGMHWEVCPLYAASCFDLPARTHLHR
jgi:hypothetical protein